MRHCGHWLRSFCFLVVWQIGVGPFVSDLLAQTPPAKVALLAGVNVYDKRGVAEQMLDYAERDVDGMAVELRKQGFTVRVLKGSSMGALRATKANIEAALAEVLKDRNSRDIVLIGFAGHGRQEPLRDDKGQVKVGSRGEQLEDAYFLPVDAAPKDSTTMISLTHLMETLDSKGGVNLVLVDACRDDPSPDRGGRSFSGNELVGRIPRNTAICFSCAAGQQALESPQAGGGHGVFFHHVLQGLQGEASNARGEVTWSRLMEYVGDNTNDQAKAWFPGRVRDLAERRGLMPDDVRLQTPHKLENLTENPVLARIARAAVIIPPVSPVPNPNPPVNNPRSNNNPIGGLTPPRSPDEITNSLGMKLKLIPAGEFLMGSPADEKSRDNDEVPHRVKISQPFYMGIHEVTKGQFAQFVNATAFKTDAEKDGKGGYGWNAAGSFEQDPKFTWRNAGFTQTDDHPVMNVGWNDAIAFCEWLSKKDGTTYELPTDAQWEYACRAGTNSPFHFGSLNNGKEANVDGNSPYGTETKGPYLKSTTSVGSYKANAFGLYDMHGNVWEWCRDGYNENAFKNLEPLTSDPVNTGGSYRVYRGGSWLYNAPYARAAARLRNTPVHRSNDLGFRVTRRVPSDQ